MGGAEEKLSKAVRGLGDDEAKRVMPTKVRDWMNETSWMVNIIVCGVFIALIVL